eukprot:g2153.t1
MFKKRKKRKLRKTSVASNDDTVDTSNNVATMQKLKSIVEDQKYRKLKRSNRGLNAEELDGNRTNASNGINNNGGGPNANDSGEISKNKLFSISSINSKSKFTTASLSIDNIGKNESVTDEKFMEYYNNNLKQDNNTDAKNVSTSSTKDAKQMIDTSMAMAEVELPQKYNVQNVKNIMKALQEKRQDNQLTDAILNNKKDGNNHTTTKKRNRNFFQQERTYFDGYHHNNNRSNSVNFKTRRSDSSVLNSFKEYESRLKRNR